MVKMYDSKDGYNSSPQYEAILYEIVANTIGIDMIPQETLERLNPEDIIKVQLGSYLNYYLKVMDENEGKKARITLKEDDLVDEDSLKKALSIDLSEEEVEKLLRNIKLIYGMNAVTSTEGNALYDWELIMDKRKNEILGLFLKSGNKRLCNLNYPEEIIESAYKYLKQNSDLLPEYIDEVKQVSNHESSMYESADNFIEMYDKNPDYLKECLTKINGIDPKQIVLTAKSKGHRIPEAYNWWFCTTVNMNKEYLNNKIQEKPYGY